MWTGCGLAVRLNLGVRIDDMYKDHLPPRSAGKCYADVLFIHLAILSSMISLLTAYRLLE